MTRRKALPPAPAGADPAVRQWMESVREQLEVSQGVRGSSLDQSVTFGDIIDIGLASFRSRGRARFNATDLMPSSEAPNLTIPPAPAFVEGIAGIGFNTITFQIPLYGNHGFAEIWRAEGAGALLGAAVRIGTTNSTVYSDFDVVEGTVYVYWVRFISTSSIAGPYHASLGVELTSKYTAATILEAIEGQLAEIHLVSSLAGRIDLIDASETGILDRLGLTEESLYDATTGIFALHDSLSDVVTDSETGLATRASQTDFNSLSSIVTDGDTGLTARALQVDFQSLITDVDGKAEASTVSQLSIDLSGLDTDVGGVVTQISTIQGDIDDILAEWAVQVVTDTADGTIISGISLMNDEGASTFQIMADNFVLWDPGANYATDNTDKDLVIGYSGGELGIDGVYIKTATIDDASIIGLTAAKITAGELTSGTWIKGGDFFGGQLRLGVGSFNRPNEDGDAAGYSSVIDSNGNAYFENAYVRGDVEATTFSAGAALPLNQVTGTGALASKSSVNYSSEVGGTKPPTDADNTKDIIEAGTLLGAGYLHLNGTDANIAIGSSRSWGTNGIHLQYNAGAPRAEFYRNGSNYLRYDNGGLKVRGDVQATSLSADTVNTDKLVTGAINVSGAWAMSGSSSSSGSPNYSYHTKTGLDSLGALDNGARVIILHELSGDDAQVSIEVRAYNGSWGGYTLLSTHRFNNPGSDLAQVGAVYDLPNDATQVQFRLTVTSTYSNSSGIGSSSGDYVVIKK